MEQQGVPEEQGAPIQEIRLMLGKDEREVAHLRSLLENKHAPMTYMSTYYLVKFPEGTTEISVDSSAAGYQEESVITFPDEATCRKVVYWPCTDPVCNHTWILFELEKELKQKRETHAQRTKKVG